MAVCLLIVSVYMRCSDFSLPRDLVPRWERHLYNGRQDHYNEIDCFINQEVSIRCRRELDEVYIPFSFLSSYFEVYGTLTTDNGGVTRFNWSHSNSKVNYPKGKYDPRGLFMYFENYNVEVRFCCFVFWFEDITWEFLGERSSEVHQRIWGCSNFNAVGETWIFLSNSNSTIWVITL